MSQDEFAGDKTQPSEEIIAALNSPVKTEQSSQSLPPLSEFDSLRTQLTEKPHSPALWKRLVEIAEQSGETEKIKVAFDSLLKQYPNTVRELSESRLSSSFLAVCGSNFVY